MLTEIVLTNISWHRWYFFIPLETPPKHCHNIEKRGCGGQDLKRETLRVQLSLAHTLNEMVLYLSRRGTLFRPRFLFICFAGGLKFIKDTKSKNPSPTPKSHRFSRTNVKMEPKSKIWKTHSISPFSQHSKNRVRRGSWTLARSALQATASTVYT